MSNENTIIHPSQASALTRTMSNLLRSREIAVLAVIVVIVVLTTLKSSSFIFSSDGWRNLLVTPSLLIVLAVGQAVVIITRNVDLSVGSTMGLTAYLAGKVFIAQPDLPVFLIFLIALAFGGALGLVNGVLVAFGRVPAMVITLGTLYIYRGIFLTWAGSDRVNASDFPSGFLSLGTDKLFGLIPYLTIIALLIMGVVGYYLRTARSGRELYAIGSDPDAAHLYGLPVTRRVLIAFVLSGAMAGLAGVIFAARYGTVSSGVGSGMELQAVGAAVIGGVAIAGGVGTVWGAALGASSSSRSTWRCRSSASATSGRRRSSELIIGAIVLDRVLAQRQERALVASRDRARLDSPPPSNDTVKAGSPA